MMPLSPYRLMNLEGHFTKIEMLDASRIQVPFVVKLEKEKAERLLIEKESCRIKESQLVLGDQYEGLDWIYDFQSDKIDPANTEELILNELNEIELFLLGVENTLDIFSLFSDAFKTVGLSPDSEIDSIRTIIVFLDYVKSHLSSFSSYAIRNPPHEHETDRVVDLSFSDDNFQNMSNAIDLLLLRDEPFLEIDIIEARSRMYEKGLLHTGFFFDYEHIRKAANALKIYLVEIASFQNTKTATLRFLPKEYGVSRLFGLPKIDSFYSLIFNLWSARLSGGVSRGIFKIESECTGFFRAWSGYLLKESHIRKAKSLIRRRGKALSDARIVLDSALFQ